MCDSRKNRAGEIRLALLALLSAWIAAADVFIPPPGLGPEDRYRLVFVTDAGIMNTTGDIQHYNAFVNAQAVGLLPPDFKWKAIVSTPSVSAIENIVPTNAPVYRLDGLPVFLSGLDMFQTNLLNPISISEFGEERESSNPHVWTGTGPDGNQTGPSGPGAALGKPHPVLNGFITGTYGNFLSVDSTWITWSPSNVPNTSRFPLYAISDELIVIPQTAPVFKDGPTPDLDPVPEPGTACMMMLGGILVIGYRRCLSNQRTISPR